MPAKKKAAPPASKGPVIQITNALMEAMFRQGLLEPEPSAVAVGNAINKVLESWVDRQSRDPAALEAIAFCEDNWGILTDWDRQFVIRTRHHARLSPQSVSVLLGIVEGTKLKLKQVEGSQWGEGEV
jgi:hypothetical protein